MPVKERPCGLGGACIREVESDVAQIRDEVEAEGICGVVHIRHVAIGVTAAGVDVGLDWEDDHLVVPAPLVEAGKCLIDFMVDPRGDFDFLTLNAHGCNEKREKQCKTSHDRQIPP